MSPDGRQAATRTLARPAGPVDEVVDALRTALYSRGFEFDPNRMLITPAETRRSAARALRLRLSILLQTYAGDYNTDSFDMDRLAHQIERGDEHIWFWGLPDQIARARTELAAAPDDPVPNLALGTVTVLSAEDEFGPGHGELCRSASVDRSATAVPAIARRMIDYHTGADRVVHERYHTLLLAARNRATDSSVRGGEAVQHIHCHHVRSRYWGIVPFYVMQGGVLECTELRESYRDPDEARRAVAEDPPWWFAAKQDAEFARALCRLNYGSPGPVTGALAPEQGDPTTEMAVRIPPSPALVPTNHATVRAEPGGLPLAKAVQLAEDSGVCCVAVHVALAEPDRLADQVWLANRGYMLTALSPPKRTWQRSAGQPARPISVGATGIWCRTRPDLPVVGPYYLHCPGADDDEEAVLVQLRSRLAALGLRAS